MTEYRSTSTRVEWRDGARSAPDARPLIFGYASIFNRETVIDLAVFAFREKIAPGTFKRAIREDDVRTLFNHDPNFVLGRTKNGTLTLLEDSHGLRYEARPPKTQQAADVRELIAGGFVTASSFAFSDAQDVWDESGMKRGKLPLRTITDVGRLLDVSPVVYPAYADATSSARSNGVIMREKTTDTRALPMGYRSVLKSMEKNLTCRRCGRHVGLDWRVRGAYALHAECAEIYDMKRERMELEARVESRTPAARARLRDAQRQLDAANRWRP